MLIDEWLENQQATDVTPLQSIRQNDWTTMLLYNNPDKSKSVWNKESLLAVRAIEDKVRELEELDRICQAMPV